MFVSSVTVCLIPDRVSLHTIISQQQQQPTCRAKQKAASLLSAALPSSSCAAFLAMPAQQPSISTNQPASSTHHQPAATIAQQPNPTSLPQPPALKHANPPLMHAAYHRPLAPKSLILNHSVPQSLYQEVSLECRVYLFFPATNPFRTPAFSPQTPCLVLDPCPSQLLPFSSCRGASEPLAG